jgi:hypothetical protein
MRYKYDKLWIGLVAGLVVPFVGYALLLMVLEQLGAVESFRDARLNFDFRVRTIAILALALNLLPLRVFRRNRANAGIRGLVLATFLYAGLWFYYFGRELL